MRLFLVQLHSRPSGDMANTGKLTGRGFPTPSCEFRLLFGDTLHGLFERF